MHKKGFTIVELLIVVVVIAILAAITIVSYNGIQNSAKNTQVVSATSAFVKAIKVYYTTHSDTVPMATSSVQCFDGKSCWSSTDVPNSLALRTELQKVVSTLPSIPDGHALLITNSSTSDSAGGTYTGWYVLYQVVNIGNECPAVGGLRYLNGGNTSDGLRTCRGALEF